MRSTCSRRVPARRAGPDAMRAVMAIVLCAVVPATEAQVFPVKPIRLVVPYAPGGGTDIVARLVAQLASAGLKQPVVIENRSGAGGIVGTELVAKAPPDGYTIVIGTTGPLAINPSMYASLPYDALRDFEPISFIAAAPHMFVVHPSLPVRSVKEMIGLARARPGSLTFSSGGNGGSNHLSAEMFNVMANVRTVHLAYRGAGPAVVAVVSGEATFAFLDVLATMPHVKTGRLRALAVTGSKRMAIAAEIPTVAEGGLPGYVSGVWYGILAPARTPAPIVARLNQEIVRAVNAPEVRERIVVEGGEVIGSSADEFRGIIKSEMARWAQVVRNAGVRAD